MTGDFLVVEAIVEIPRGSRNKYEFDADTQAIRLDRVLFSSAHYPGDYGFVVGTRCGDGDPVDVLILVEEPTFPGCRIRVRPIGVLIMDDEAGEDEKILGVPEGDPRFAEVYDLKDLPQRWLAEVENFFATYKVLEGKAASPSEWKGAKEACLVVARRWCQEACDKQRETSRDAGPEPISAIRGHDHTAIGVGSETKYPHLFVEASSCENSE